MKQVNDNHHDEEVELDNVSGKTSPFMSSLLDKSSPLTHASKPPAKTTLPPLARVNTLPSVTPVSNKYEDLNVSQNIKDVFKFIDTFTPLNVEIDSTFKPFIPDYEPAIGEVDAFLKVPRPDGKPDVLGLSRIDEPSVTGSDPALVTMQLKALSKSHAPVDEEVAVRSIDRAEENPDEITKWIASIEKMHVQLPLPTVQYSRRYIFFLHHCTLFRMPDMDKLMQAWPPEAEALLTPGSLDDLIFADLSLEEFLRVLSAILQIPVYSKLIDSAHLLFSLFLESQNNQHFARN